MIALVFLMLLLLIYWVMKRFARSVLTGFIVMSPDSKTRTGIVVLIHGENGLEQARKVAIMVFSHSGK